MRCCCAAAESAGAAAPEPGTLTETIHGRYPRLTWREQAIVTGLGAAPRDSMGNPWHATYTVSSGNLLADMRFNVTAESQESRWAGGPSKDDRGEIEYVAEPQAMGPEIDENESEGPKRKSSSLFHR